MRRTARAIKRETPQIFDLILKRLLRLSSRAVIQFINGLFGTDHSPDGVVEYPNVENVSRKLRRLLSDTIVIVNGVQAYHLEAEIGDDEDMVVRVFEYGFAEGLRTKTVADGGKRISLKFPKARIIYWETTNRTPDEVVLSMEFPDGGHYDYKVEALKFLDHGIEELVEQKLAILLPFHVLKLRKRVVSAKTRTTRVRLAGEMRTLLDELTAAVGNAVRTGLMSEADSRSVLEYTERLYRELYRDYNEFKEADVTLQDTILTYSEEAERRGIKKGRREGRKEGRKEGIEKGIEKGIKKGKEEMAKNLLANGVSPDVIASSAGLPVEKIKALVS